MIPDAQNYVSLARRDRTYASYKREMVRRGQELAEDVWLRHRDEFPIPLLLAAEIRLLRVAGYETCLHTAAMSAYRARLRSLRGE